MAYWLLTAAQERGRRSTATILVVDVLAACRSRTARVTDDDTDDDERSPPNHHLDARHPQHLTGAPPSSAAYEQRLWL
jgi:hypothetical protein